MANSKILTCQVSGNTVYVRDERGTMVDMFNMAAAPTAQSFGNGITITSNGICFTYVLDDNGRLKQVGNYAV